MSSQAAPRMTNEYRHTSSGSLNIPPPTALNGSGGGPPPPAGGMGRFEGPRSPPGRQNTSHVPCKFFKQGACQAGSACPFSHDLASTNEGVCKYFAKGNCKFGPKCANLHILPDGRRVNYKHGGAMGNGHLNIGGRLNNDGYHNRPTTSTLTNSFMGTNGAPPPYAQQYPYEGNNPYPPMIGRHQSIDINVPTIDTSYTSHAISNYGSPRDEDHNRLGLGLSPVPLKGLSVLDAQLPASFDSNGISMIARYGPIASSVPAKFGLDSPPSSLGAAKDGRTSEALKSLQLSAFGDDTRDRFNGMPSSPPTNPTEEYFGKRTMHSQRYAKPKVMSSSLPKADLEWDPHFGLEEDLLPETLQDLMTPQEKARRGSRTANDEGRPIYSGAGTPNHDIGIKFGSPSNASPSRWNGLFQRKEEEDRARASAFGHVGSPLRNSSLHLGASPSARPIARPTVSGDSSPYLASPPRQASLISRELQRTRLARNESSSSELPIRGPNSSLGGSRAVAERQVSSSSMSNGGSGRFTTPIDEEQGDFMFNLEGMEDSDEKRGEKRNSGGWTFPTTNRVSGGRGGLSNVTNGRAEGMFGAR